MDNFDKTVKIELTRLELRGCRNTCDIFNSLIKKVNIKEKIDTDLYLTVFYSTKSSNMIATNSIIYIITYYLKRRYCWKDLEQVKGRLEIGL